MAVEKSLYSGGASSVLFTDRRDFYLPNDVKELWSDVTPFLTAVANTRQFKPKDVLFKNFEYRSSWIKQMFKLSIAGGAATINGNGAASTLNMITPLVDESTVFGLGLGGNHLIGLICSVHAVDAVTGKPSGKRVGNVLITAYTAGTPNTIGVKNLSATSFTLADNTDYWFVVVGNAHGEGSESPEPWADELKVTWGSCQIFRTPLQVTKTLIEAALRGEPNELIRLRREKSKEHKMQKERTFLFGASLLKNNLVFNDSFGDTHRTDASGEPVRTTTGIFEALLDKGVTDTNSDYQNIFEIVEDKYKYANFVDDCEKMFQYIPSSGTKDMYASAKMISYWSKMDASRGFAKNSGWAVQMSTTQNDKMGFNFRTLETPHGLIRLIHTPILTHSAYNGWGLITDLDNLGHAVYEPEAYHQNIKTDNAPLIQKDEYYGYEGLQIRLFPTHKLINLK